MWLLLALLALSQPASSGQAEIMTLGSLHIPRASPPSIPVEAILEQLARFGPGLIALEILHPSLDPADTSNYRFLAGDKRLLKKLWDLEKGDLDEALLAAQADLATEKDEIAKGHIRIRLGKIFYLQGDVLNAAYQWWRAGRMGADVGELKRLVDHCFEGREIQVLGFALAERLGHEYVCPFDYQGKDAVWDTDPIFEQARQLALFNRFGKEPGAEGYDQLAAEYDRQLAAYAEGDRTWSDHYGHMPRMKAFSRYFFDRMPDYKATEAEASRKHRFGIMGFLQSEQNMAIEREDFALLAELPFDNLGREIVEGYELRNQRMFDFLEADIRRLRPNRVLIIVGSSHKDFLDRIAAERGYRVVSSELE